MPSIYHCGESDYSIRPAFAGSVSTECSFYPRAIMKAGVFTKHFSLIAVVLHERFIRCKRTILSAGSEKGNVKWWAGEQSILWVGLLWNCQGNRRSVSPSPFLLQVKHSNDYCLYASKCWSAFYLSNSKLVSLKRLKIAGSSMLLK